MSATGPAAVPFRVAQIRSDAGPRWAVRVFFLLFLTGACSRGYGDYNQTLLHDPSTWTRVLNGTAAAPEQYRVAVVFAADAMSRHLPFTLSQSFAILDMLFSMLAVVLLFDILERTPDWRAAPLSLRFFGAAAFAALAVYALDWASWYHRVTTLPTAGLVAVLAWLLTPRSATLSKPGTLVLSLAVFAVAVTQSFIRADIVVALFAGIFLAASIGLGTYSVSRLTAIALSFAGIATGVTAQWYLARIRYPQASYGRVPILMIFHDYRQWAMWMAMLLFVAPLLWTLVAARRSPNLVAGAGPALLIAAVGYLAIFITLGRLDEVRIFLPMALATSPATVALAMARVGSKESAIRAEEGTSLG